MHRAENRLWSQGCSLLVATCLVSAPVQAQAPAAVPAPAAPAAAQTAASEQVKLLRAAQLWANKNRADLARQLLQKLLLADPSLPIALASLGELALRENKTEEAQRLLAKLQAQHPQHALTKELAQLVQVYGPEREKLAQMRLMARAGRLEEASQLARELFPLGPPSVGNLALEYFQIVGNASGQGAQAQRNLQQLYQKTGESRYQLALLELQLSQGSSAQTLLPRIEALADQADADPLALQNLWRRALAEPTSGAIGARSAERFLQRFPGDALVVERLAALQQVQERTEKIAKDPVHLARNAALRAIDQGNTALAEQKLQLVLSLRPRDAESIGNLGLIRLRQGQHAQAQELLDQAFALSGQDKWAQLQATARFWGLLRQVDVALDAKEIDTAESLARKALALQPSSSEALSALAGIRALQNALPEAKALYEKALMHEADNSTALKGLANVYTRGGQPDKALALLDKAAANDATLAGKLAGVRADLLQEQAKAFLQVQRPSAALRALETAVALAPDEAWVRHSLAQLYVRLELPKEALSVMDDGVALAPAEPSMRYARALIRSALDDEDGALADMQQVPAKQRSDGMRELVQRASVNQLIDQATSTNAPPSALTAQGLLQRAEALADNDDGLLYAVANAWFKRGQSSAGIAVFDRLEQRLGTLPAAVQLDYAALLHRAQDDDAVAQRLPELLAQLQWTSAQEAQLLALYGNHQERLIERDRTAGAHRQAVQRARAPLPTMDASANANATNATNATNIAQQRRRVQAQLLAAAGEYADATALLEVLVAELPDDAALRLALGDALSRQGRNEAAAVQARWLAQQLPQADTNQQLALLRLWQRAGQMQAARDLSLQLLQSTPADTDVLLHAARLERADRQYAQALALFQRAQVQETHSAGLDIPPAPDAPLKSSSVLLALVPSERPTSATGLESAQLSDSPSSELEPLSLLYSLRLSSPGAVAVVAAPAESTGNTALDKINAEINAIEARRQAWVESGYQSLHKTATEGISSLHGWELPTVAWIPKTDYSGHYFLHLDQVQLDAGQLPLDAGDAGTFGQVAAWPESAYRSGGVRQRHSGSNVGVGFVGDRLEWDIGATGIGFPVTNVVGGISYSDSDSTERFNYQFGISRRPMTGNLMTYAGAHDPITGQIWGGVVATGASMRFSTDVGPYSTSLSTSYALLTGKNVRRNTRLQMRWEANRDVWQSRHSTVNLALALSAWRYGHDLSEFTWGHGGYYSPRSYLSLSLPVEWSGRKNQWTWLVRGALSVSRSSSQDTDFFPNTPRLQAQATALGSQPVYLGSRSTGFGRSLRSALEYDLSRQLTLGAQLEIDRSAYYAPTNLLFYVRYRFDPVLASSENRPRPVQTYSSF